VNHVVLPIVLGLTEGLVLTLIALGLVLTYGMMRIVNLAHGGFFMLGAFTLASLVGLSWARSVPGFIGAIALAAALQAVLGVILERTVYTRMYGRPHVSAFLAMFALMLVIVGVVQLIWGINARDVAVPSGLGGAMTVGSVRVPDYYLFVIAVALIALAITAVILFGTQIGLWTRAIAADRDMAAALGCNVRQVFSIMFGLGCVLAGVAGALTAPMQQVDSTLGTAYIIQAFAIVLIGGLGSLPGAVAAGLALGLVDAFLAVDYPPLSGYGIYLAMIVAMLVRPQGLFRRASSRLAGAHE
jgi:branched-subunit amino acid ABC-type transport system permease component